MTPCANLVAARTTGVGSGFLRSANKRALLQLSHSLCVDYRSYDWRTSDEKNIGSSSDYGRGGHHGNCSACSRGGARLRTGPWLRLGLKCVDCQRYCRLKPVLLWPELRLLRPALLLWAGPLCLLRRPISTQPASLLLSSQVTITPRSLA